MRTPDVCRDAWVHLPQRRSGTSCRDGHSSAPTDRLLLCAVAAVVSRDAGGVLRSECARPHHARDNRTLRPDVRTRSTAPLPAEFRQHVPARRAAIARGLGHRGLARWVANALGCEPPPPISGFTACIISPPPTPQTSSRRKRRAETYDLCAPQAVLTSTLSRKV